MKRIVGMILALCVAAAMAAPVSAKTWKTVQSIDRTRFSYCYDKNWADEEAPRSILQRGKAVNGKLKAGTFEPGDEIRIYLNPTDFIADGGIRMDNLMPADLKDAKIDLYTRHDEDNRIDAEDLYRSFKLRYDKNEETVYISMRLKEALPADKLYVVKTQLYLTDRGRRIDETVLDLTFSVDAR